MQEDRSKLAEQAFGLSTRAPVIVKYRAFVEAVDFLRAGIRDPETVELLHGPALSGKSTVVQEFASSLSERTAVAIVDAERIRPVEFLVSVLSEFGYDTGLHSADELLKMISVFASQQLRSSEAPILIVDNIDRAYPSTRIVLNAMTSLKTQGQYAIRLVLTSRSASVSGVPSRSLRRHDLSPLSQNEAMHYLHSRLQAVGIKHPDAVIPIDRCDRLFEQSAGLPGQLNKMARTEVAPVPPRLVVTRDSEVLQDYTFKDSKVLIGRSGFADIIVPDPFTSKLHAAMLLFADALVLIDLNSANGTTVNSRQVKSTILKDDDIIALGHHRIKVMNPPIVSPEIEEILEKQDTVKMRNLLEARRTSETKTLSIVSRR